MLQRECVYVLFVERCNGEGDGMEHSNEGRAAAQTDSDPTISRLIQMQSLEWSRGTEGTNKGRKMTRDEVAVPVSQPGRC